MNTLIVIGFMSAKTCYLNVPEAEARARYTRDNDYEHYYDVEIYTFKDTFNAYDIWGAE